MACVEDFDHQWRWCQPPVSSEAEPGKEEGHEEVGAEGVGHEDGAESATHQQLNVQILCFYLKRRFFM